MAKLGKDTRIKLFSATLIFNVDTDKIDEFEERLEVLEGKSKDLTSSFERFDRYYHSSVMATFEAEGRPKKWASLAPSTQRQRARQGFGASHPILVRRGNMKNRFKSKSTKRTYQFYNTAKFFHVHQKGNSHVPQRVMIQFLEEDKRELREIIVDELKDETR